MIDKQHLLKVCQRGLEIIDVQYNQLNILTEYTSKQQKVIDAHNAMTEILAELQSN